MVGRIYHVGLTKFEIWNAQLHSYRNVLGLSFPGEIFMGAIVTEIDKMFRRVN